MSSLVTVVMSKNIDEVYTVPGDHWDVIAGCLNVYDETGAVFQAQPHTWTCVYLGAPVKLVAQEPKVLHERAEFVEFADWLITALQNPDIPWSEIARRAAIIRRSEDTSESV